jgi:acylphosphatase
MFKRIESGIAGKGLGFDYLSSIKDVASNLELEGTVSLKDDGSIKIIAEGEEKSLLKFTKKLERNFFFSPIENFYIIWHEPTREFNNFFINHN